MGHIASERKSDDLFEPLAALDPVVAVGRELARLWEESSTEIKKPEDSQVADDAWAHKCDEFEKNNHDCVLAHEAYISSMQARSLPGALVQLAVLNGLADFVGASDTDDRQRQLDQRQMLRLINSIAGVLRQHCFEFDSLAESYFGIRISPSSGSK